jgi:glyoxylase-like metal-dependent hydrolase (beta-lactamase superfamily II)
MTEVHPLVDHGHVEDSWIHGHRRGRPAIDQPLQVRALVDRTFVMRQSKTVTFEAPFLYLLLGDERALLLDTGDVEDRATCDVRAAVDALVPDDLELVVLHTHGHRDHHRGDAQLADRPRTRVVATDLDAVRHELGISRWPEEVVTYDLGGRVLEVFGIPGHHETSIAVYDARTRSLLTGDTVYPGRLYARDPDTFRASIERLTAYALDRKVKRVLGCHIELADTPGVDYPVGCRWQPREASLVMSLDDLVTIRDGVRQAAARPGVFPLGPAILWNGPCRGPALRQAVRTLGLRVAGRG